MRDRQTKGKISWKTPLILFFVLSISWVVLLVFIAIGSNDVIHSFAAFFVVFFGNIASIGSLNKNLSDFYLMRTIQHELYTTYEYMQILKSRCNHFLHSSGVESDEYKLAMRTYSKKADSYNEKLSNFREIYKCKPLPKIVFILTSLLLMLTIISALASASYLLYEVFDTEEYQEILNTETEEYQNDDVKFVDLPIQNDDSVKHSDKVTSSEQEPSNDNVPIISNIQNQYIQSTRSTKLYEVLLLSYNSNIFTRFMGNQLTKDYLANFVQNNVERRINTNSVTPASTLNTNQVYSRLTTNANSLESGESVRRLRHYVENVRSNHKVQTEIINFTTFEDEPDIDEILKSIINYRTLALNEGVQLDLLERLRDSYTLLADYYFWIGSKGDSTEAYANALYISFRLLSYIDYQVGDDNLRSQRLGRIMYNMGTLYFRLKDALQYNAHKSEAALLSVFFYELSIYYSLAEVVCNKYFYAGMANHYALFFSLRLNQSAYTFVYDARYFFNGVNNIDNRDAINNYLNRLDEFERRYIH